MQMANLMLGVAFLARGNNESGTKSFRVGGVWDDKIKRARETGEVLTHLCPGWLRIENRKFTLPDKTKAVLTEIFENAAAGIGPDATARDFNRRGVPTFGRTGLRGRVLKKADGWYASYIKKLLNNRSVLGEFQPGSKPRDMPWEAVGDAIREYFPRAIEDDLWHRARHRRRKRLPTGGPSKSFRSNLPRHVFLRRLRRRHGVRGQGP
jgi:hypothetical protein